MKFVLNVKMVIFISQEFGVILLSFGANHKNGRISGLEHSMKSPGFLSEVLFVHVISLLCGATMACLLTSTVVIPEGSDVFNQDH